MTEYRLIEEPRVEDDGESAFRWYENEQPGLGDQFLGELYACYERILRFPLGYQDLEDGIRRALLRRFPYGVYFAVDGDAVVVLTVLHTSRDPAEWQRQRPGQGT